MLKRRLAVLGFLFAAVFIGGTICHAAINDTITPSSTKEEPSVSHSFATTNESRSINRPGTVNVIWDLSMSPLNVFSRLGMAVVFGALVGWERQRHQKHADPRTLILVALGAALFIVAVEEVNATYPESNRLAMIGSIIGGLIGGVGFLGAGAIMHQEKRVEGVTTAAAIWVTAGIGVTCGLGEFALSIIAGTTVLTTLMAATIFKPLSKNDAKADGNQIEKS